MTRTFEVKVKINGVEQAPEIREAEINTTLTRSGVVAFEALSISKEHFNAFVDTVKAAGAKFSPGLRAWTLKDKAENLADTLRADGFRIVGFYQIIDD